MAAIKQKGTVAYAFREIQVVEAVEKEVRDLIHWGGNNLYPQELVSMLQDNPVHGGIVNQKITFIASAGVEVVASEEVVTQIEGLINEVVVDFEIFNGFAVRFDRVGERVVASHVPFESVRASSCGKKYTICDNWQAPKNKNTTSVTLPSLRYATDNDEAMLAYILVKPKQRKLQNGKLSLNHYPVPSYIGAVTSILAGIEQDFFTLSEAVNGYKGGTLVNLANGQPATDEETDKIADTIKGEATDRNRQGGIVVTFSDGKDNAPEVMSLNGNDLDKRYLESNKEIRNKILIGHSVGSPTLFGVNSESVFGSKEEMEIAYALFSNNYVAGRQCFIEQALEWCFTRVGSAAVVKFKKYILQLAPDILDVPVPAGTNTELSKASVFANIGTLRTSMQIIKSRPFDLVSSDAEFLFSFERMEELSALHSKIVALISEGKSFNQVAKAVNKSALGLAIEYVKLNQKGVLKGWRVAPTEAKLKVLYSYEVKQGLGDAVLPTTRDFCRDLVELDRLYTRAEIDRLSNELNTDVWRYRGGWYNNPTTGRTTPSCRHEWVQNIVRS